MKELTKKEIYNKGFEDGVHITFVVFGMIIIIGFIFYKAFI